MKVASVAEMRALDAKATEAFGISQDILMENAGQAVYFVILKELGIKNRRFIIFCGSGNNGGDGFVVARKIHSSGGEVKVFLLSNKGKYKGSARKNLEIISKFPIEIKEINSVNEVKNDVHKSDALIDAIFGTGLDRNIEGIYREVIELLNKSRKKVFSVDIASGINGDSGQEMGTSVRADHTITFGLPKTGNLLYPGYGRGGKLYVSHISFPPSLYDSIKVEIPPPCPLPERRPDTSKMDYGPVLVIAGASNYFWAPHASAYSFLKAGGGYVYLACPKGLVPSIAKKGREVVFQPQRETASGSIAPENKESLLELSKRMKLVILGPGISLDEETQNLARDLARTIDRPLLIDGDGITAISSDTEIIKQRKAVTILTPHMGEMARITRMAKEAIERNRVGILAETAKNLNAIIVLKGPHTLIGYPDGRVVINVSGITSGRAGMATAGSGDVLNGTIAAMLCLGLDINEAARTGVFIHGFSGDLAAKRKGPDGMTAQDTLDFLPDAVKYYRENISEIAENFYDTIYSV